MTASILRILIHYCVILTLLFVCRNSQAVPGDCGKSTVPRKNASLSTLTLSLEKSRSDAVLRLKNARDLFKRGRDVESLAAFSSWLMVYSDHEEAREILLHITRLETDLDSLIDYIKELVSSHPESPVSIFAYYKLGEAYFLKRDIQGAILSFRAFLSLDPDDPAISDARRKLAACLMSEEKYREALEQFCILQENTSTSADLPGILYPVAECQAQLGRYEDAVRTLRYVINKFPNFSRLSNSYFLLGLCYEERGEYESAREWYSELIRLFPGSIENNFALIRKRDIESTLNIFILEVPEKKMEKISGENDGTW
jgi:TolA-binding protein